jgi:hypothetical protein
MYVRMDYSEPVNMAMIASLLWICIIQKKINSRIGWRLSLGWMMVHLVIPPKPCPLDIKLRDGWRIKVLSS